MRVLIICALAIKTAHKEGRPRTEAKASAHGMKDVFNHMTCCLASCCVQKIASLEKTLKALVPVIFIATDSSEHSLYIIYLFKIPVGAPVAAWF